MSVDMCMILNGIVMIFLSKSDTLTKNNWRNDKPSPCATVDHYLTRRCPRVWTLEESCVIVVVVVVVVDVGPGC